MKKGKVKKFMKEHCVEIGGFMILMLGWGAFKIHCDRKAADTLAVLKNDVRVGVLNDLFDAMGKSDGIAHDFDRPWKIKDLGRFGETLLSECPSDNFTLDTDVTSVVFTVKK